MGAAPPRPPAYWRLAEIVTTRVSAYWRLAEVAGLTTRRLSRVFLSEFVRALTGPCDETHVFPFLPLDGGGEGERDFRSCSSWLEDL